MEIEDLGLIANVLAPEPEDCRLSEGPKDVHKRTREECAGLHERSYKRM